MTKIMDQGGLRRQHDGATRQDRSQYSCMESWSRFHTRILTRLFFLSMPFDVV